MSEITLLIQQLQQLSLRTPLNAFQCKPPFVTRPKSKLYFMHGAIEAVNDAAISMPKTLKWRLMCSTKLCDTLYNFICTLKRVMFLNWSIIMIIVVLNNCQYHMSLYYAHPMWLLQPSIRSIQTSNHVSKSAANRVMRT